ncbi:MAG TPA: Fur family transcriptional regulator [Desulfobacteria bacterium]|nr:Fur family transcriptional regulator [Desulfobacteria bacterium]
MLNYETITQRLREHGYRLTEARSQVIRVLCNSSDYIGAYDIHNTLKSQGASIGLVSVYRVLELLCHLGLVQSEEFGAGGEKFRLNRGRHTHQIICSICGVAKEFGNCGIGDLAQDLEEASGYKIKDHWLRFFGVCPTCQARQGSNPGTNDK